MATPRAFARPPTFRVRKRVTGTRPGPNPFFQGPSPNPFFTGRPVAGTPADPTGPPGTPPGGGGGSGGTSPPAPTAPSGPTPPPKTPEDEAARISAQQAYDVSAAGIHNQMYQAALRYGDPTTMGQFSAYGPTVDNPNSDLAVAARNQQNATTNLNEGTNRANTFFSGIHQRQQGTVDDTAARARLSAQQRYEEAYNNLANALLAAGATRDEAVRAANAGDVSAAAASLPMGPAAPIAGPAPPSGGPVAIGGKPQKPSKPGKRVIKKKK